MLKQQNSDCCCLIEGIVPYLVCELGRRTGHPKNPICCATTQEKLSSLTTCSQGVQPKKMERTTHKQIVLANNFLEGLKIIKKKKEKKMCILVYIETCMGIFLLLVKDNYFTCIRYWDYIPCNMPLLVYHLVIFFIGFLSAFSIRHSILLR